MKITVLLIILLVSSMCSRSQPPNPQVQSLSSAQSRAKLSYRIIASEKQTWGYDIYNSNKLYIHQPTIPALPGNIGFATKEAAVKVAKLIILKIRKGEIPPVITTEEMKKLKLIN